MMMKYLKGFGACIVFSLTFLFTSTNAIAQTCGSDCITCIEGGPCCTVYNACNAYQTYCFDCDAYYGTTDVGCDLSCAPIDSGILFLIFGGAMFGMLLLYKNNTRVRPVFGQGLRL